VKVSKVMVVAESAAQVKELVSAASVLGEEIVLVYAGAREIAAGANKAYWLGELANDSFVNHISTVVELANAEQPKLVLFGNGANGRLAATHVAVANNTAVLSDISELEVVEDGILTKRMVYGGAAFKTDKSTAATTVVVLSPRAFPVEEQESMDNITDATEGKEVAAFNGKQVIEETGPNLATAKRVISVGRGLGSEELLEPVNAIAKALGCAVGCSRPVAEEYHWMPKSAYIGVSGAMVKADAYIALGISGQIQHMVGVNGSRTIFAVNKDKNASIFQQCDYGLVADLAVLVPLLVEKLKEN